MQLHYSCPKILCAESAKVFMDEACQTIIPPKPQLNHYLS